MKSILDGGIPLVDVMINESERNFMADIKGEILRLDREVQMINQALQEKVGARKELQAIWDRKADELLKKYNLDNKKDYELNTDTGEFKKRGK